MPVDHEDAEGGTPSNVSRSPKHGGPAIEGPLLSVDLQAALAPLRREQSYHDGKSTGRTLVKESNLRIVLFALRTGARIQEHRASGPISIQGIEGLVRVHVLDQDLEVGVGQLVALEANLLHDVEALEDSAFLLTIGRTTYDQVSDWHEPGD